ncbi:hypothetical protein EUGRSUZ_C02062 [Eucalyptus grandis]|uniref:TIR domain-containing protein n=2 Tax=Eucalyptus grandis TaxID=71139 RepID=A0A059CQD1_EUCGR|nr:hypothetical protein EUGRSUZ_C02062 [Eucalyptus grandis]
MAFAFLARADVAPAEVFDVYLSFRGSDRVFVDHLCGSLEEAGIRVVWDQEVEVVRKPIPIAIPILSENYPCSSWCLRELAEIVEDHKTMGKIIMPVFLNITPSVVKNISHGYREAINKHRRKGVKPATLRKWEEALIHVGSISGLATNRHFVGMEHREETVMKLLNVESSDVHVVGIHGIGGTGKTTIAKFVYKRIFHLFDGCSFLESFRENAKKPGGLVDLQCQLISDLLGATQRQIPSEDGINSIRSRFFHKKVLIVFDDIEPGFELTPILGSLDWLGSGSRIIITTRAEQALDKLEVILKYKVGGMQRDEALTLFHIHAFREKPALNEFVFLSKEIVSTIDQLPLTIEVVGSYLFSRGADVWIQTLYELEKVPKLQVEQKLMVIIKALPDKLRQIFLDIACFFIGEDKSVACSLWSGRDSASGLELQMLIRFSIVKIENNKLWMHDQLRDLGRDIVEGEHREPRNRSRLWLQDEALDVLTNEKGTDNVQGVLLKFDSRSQCSFKPAHFASMSNIRFLRLDQANLEGKFEQCLSSLRWLHWRGCPRNLCAGNLNLKKLVILDLSWSKVNEKWNGWREIEKAEKLKVLNLTGCVDLIRTPDLSYYKCLERLILERCIRLVEISSSIKSLERLVSLNLRSCTELNKLPEELGSLISLEEILIDETAVQEIPVSIDHLQKLRIFSACNCLSLIQLPDSISHVKSLRVFTLNGTKITELPLSKELEVLRHLSINHCRSILKLPTSLGSLASLIKLDLSSTGIVELPNTVNKLNLLEVLKIDFTFVRELPGAIWKLKRLEELHASRCRSLVGEIPRDIEKLSRLRVLRLGYSRIRGLPDSISRLPNLQTLDLLHCDKLHRVPNLPSSLISLSLDELENLIFLASLNVSYCQSLERLPDLSKLKKLKDIKIKGCPKIRDIKSVEHLHSFEKPSSAIIETESSSEVTNTMIFPLDHIDGEVLFDALKHAYTGFVTGGV